MTRPTRTSICETGKGFVWVNEGHGRYWYVGPQQTSTSGTMLRKENEIVVLELLNEPRGYGADISSLPSSISFPFRRFGQRDVRPRTARRVSSARSERFRRHTLLYDGWDEPTMRFNTVRRELVVSKR